MNIKSKFGYLCCASLLTTSLWAQDVLISTRNTSLLLDAPVGGEVRFIYYGDKLSTSDAATLLETEQKTFSAYPVYGLNCPSESALSVTHGDGNMTLQLEVIKVDTRKEQTADITTIRLKDKVYPFYMNLCYRTYPDADIIETWTEITHEEKKAITLNRFASAYKSRKTKRDGCEKRNAFIETKTKCASNLIRKVTVYLQNQSKTPSLYIKINGIQMDF